MRLFKKTNLARQRAKETKKEPGREGRAAGGMERVSQENSGRKAGTKETERRKNIDKREKGSIFRYALKFQK